MIHFLYHCQKIYIQEITSRNLIVFPTKILLLILSRCSNELINSSLAWKFLLRPSIYFAHSSILALVFLFARLGTKCNLDIFGIMPPTKQPPWRRNTLMDHVLDIPLLCLQGVLYCDYVPIQPCLTRSY